MAAHDQGHAAAGERVQRGQRGQDVGGQAVVHELNPVHLTGDLEAMVQGSEPGGGGPEPGVVVRAGHAQRHQAAPGDQGVAAVVPAEQAERLHPGRVRLVGLLDPPHAGTEQRRVLAEQVAVAVGHGQVGTGLGAGRELVPVVVLHPAVPVQVIGVQRGHGHHRRRAGQVGGLVAGDLDHPVVVVVPGLRVIGRPPDVAAHQAPVAEAARQVTGDGRGGALALGPGDQQNAAGIGLLEPQPEAAGHRNAPLLQRRHLRAVPADPGRLDHHVALCQRGQPAVRSGQHGQAAGLGRGRAVVDQHRLGAQRGEPAQVGVALAAEAPYPGAGAAQVGPGQPGARHGQASSSSVA